MHYTSRMAYLSGDPEWFTPTPFLEALDQKTLRWEIPNDCNTVQADPGGFLKCKHKDGKIAVKLYGALESRDALSPRKSVVSQYACYMTEDGIGLIVRQGGAESHVHFNAIQKAF